MTARSIPSRRTLIASSLAAAGLVLSAGLAQAADSDVSNIHGRASAPTLQAHNGASSNWGSAPGSGYSADSHVHSTQPVDSATETTSYPVTVSQAQGTQSPPQSADSGDYLSTPQTAGASDAVITPTGRYLDVGDTGTMRREEDVASIHEENIDGVPLTEGRGMREGVDFHAAAPVYADPLFDVTDVLGRASPPAPEDAEPYFGVGS